MVLPSESLYRTAILKKHIMIIQSYSDENSDFRKREMIDFVSDIF